MEKRLSKLNRRYKRFKALKWLFLISSIGVAIFPAIVVAFKVAPSVPHVKIEIRLTSVAAFIIAIGLIFIIKGLKQRYAHKLPWATIALIWSWVFYCLVVAIKRVIAQAEQISLALAFGVSAAFLLALASELCRVLADAANSEYERLK